MKKQLDLFNDINDLKDISGVRTRNIGDEDLYPTSPVPDDYPEDEENDEDIGYMDFGDSD